MRSIFPGGIRRRFFIPAASILFCGMCLLQAPAQDTPQDLTELSIEDLNKVEVYSASKFSQKLTDAPASISIITAADIQHYGYRKLSQILGSVAGFYSTNDRNYEYMGVRGFGRTGDYNTRILFLLNGLRLNESVYGGTGIGFDFPIDINLIEKIEIVRGPGSSLYGTNAFFATVNIITKRGRSMEGMHAYGQGGSWNSYTGSASFGKTYQNGVEMLVSGTYRDSKGQRNIFFPEFDSPDTNHGIAEDLDTERSGSIFANISGKNLTAQFAYNSRKKGIPTASFGTVFNHREAQTRDSIAYLDLKYERKIRKTYDLLSRIYLGIYNYSGIYGYNNVPEDANSYFSKNLDFAAGRWLGGDFQLTRTIAGKHHLTIGTDLQYSFHTRQRNYDSFPSYYLYLDTNDQWGNVGSYLQGEFALRENLLLSAGVRHDQYSTFGGNTSPRFGIVYSPKPKTTFKVLQGYAFRAPNSYEIFYKDEYTQKANPDLKPEKIRTAEFIMEQYFGLKYRAALSVYHYNVDKMINQYIDADGMSGFRNSGQTNATGMELSLEGKDFYGFDGRLSYALQRTESDPDKQILANSPKHLVHFNLFLPCFATRGGSGLEFRYMGSRTTFTGERLGGFLTVNASVIFKNLLPNVDITASLYNILDRRFADPAGTEILQGSIMQDGRSFRVRVDYGLGSK